MINNLDRLKVFYAIYAHQRVGEAAKHLHVSQSAVSQALQKLEQEIKTPLFTRLSRRLIPTQAGHQLFETVEPFMLNLEGCLKMIEQGKAYPFGELRVGAPHEFGKFYLPALVAKFREQYPNVCIHLNLGDQRKLMSLLEVGEIDLAVVDLFQNQRRHVGNHDGFLFTPIAQEKTILACSAPYFEGMGGAASWEALAQQEFVTYRPDAQSIRAWFKHHFGKANLNVQPVFVVDSHQAIVSAIKHHLGLGIVASHLVHAELNSGQMIAIQTDRPHIQNEISLVQLKNKVPTLTEETFISYLLKIDGWGPLLKSG